MTVDRLRPVGQGLPGVGRRAAAAAERSCWDSPRRRITPRLPRVTLPHRWSRRGRPVARRSHAARRDSGAAARSSPLVTEQRRLRVVRRDGDDWILQPRLGLPAAHDPNVAKIAASVGFQRRDFSRVVRCDRPLPVEPRLPPCRHRVSQFDSTGCRSAPSGCATMRPSAGTTWRVPTTREDGPERRRRSPA